MMEQLQVNLFLDLTRMKKPIGYMLLFWPCSWGLTLVYDFSENLNTYFFYSTVRISGPPSVTNTVCSY